MPVDVHHHESANDHTHHHLPDNVANELLFTGGVWSYITGSGIFTTDPDPSDREWIGIGSPILFFIIITVNKRRQLSHRIKMD